MCSWVNGRVDEIVAKYRHEDNSRPKIMLCVWMLAPSICCRVCPVIRYELRLVMTWKHFDLLRICIVYEATNSDRFEHDSKLKALL